MPATDRIPAGRAVAAVARWTLILHAALLAAQPFLAGAMLDAMSPSPQTMHRIVAMTVVAIAIVQVFVTLAAWKGRAGWPRDAFHLSLMLLGLELVQFTLGHLSLGMALHIPLGIASLAAGVYIAVRFARRPVTNRV
ncbi:MULTISPECIES: hypothetical protein [Leucobacter]|uniref:hypothetical protein n=1 Tax=Leucobacter TaxID=55968 RepID=UPI000E657147|nr:hypothetical protein [Leucobacter aridicollis]UTX52548.1 hypothetical protein KI794_12485 [Leucobacter aridicollis]